MIRKLRNVVPLMFLLLIAAGCANVAKPEGWASPGIVDDRLYVSLRDGEMSSLDAGTFETLWTFPADDEFACGDGREEEHDLRGIYGRPAVGDDLVFMGAYDSNVYALNKEDGSCQWLFETGDWIVGGVVLSGDLLYVPSTDGKLYVVNPETGEEVLSVEVGDVWSTPTITDDGEHIYVATMDGEMWKFGTDPLVPAWDTNFEVSTGLLTSPVEASDDIVIVGGIGHKLFGVNTANGREEWTFEGKNWFWGEPAVDNGTVYATTLGARAYAIHVATGEEIWEFEAVHPIRAGAVVSGDTVIVVDDKGIVNLIDAATGDLIQDVELDRSVYATPYLTEDSVLVLTRSGKVFAIDLETGRATEVVD